MRGRKVNRHEEFRAKGVIARDIAKTEEVMIGPCEVEQD